jgi:hypothetical protein
MLANDGPLLMSHSHLWGVLCTFVFLETLTSWWIHTRKVCSTIITFLSTKVWRLSSCLWQKFASSWSCILAPFVNYSWTIVVVSLCLHHSYTIIVMLLLIVSSSLLCHCCCVFVASSLLFCCWRSYTITSLQLPMYLQWSWTTITWQLNCLFFVFFNLSFFLVFLVTGSSLWLCWTL